VLQKLYRYIFWTGYVAVLIATFLPLRIRVDKIKFGPEVFEIRLDHLLHFSVYFLICLYYVIGRLKGLTLFKSSALTKFCITVLLLAVITETVQLWVPARSFNLFDLTANIAGLTAGTGVIYSIKNLKIRK
jgi:VanZ family protein